MEGASAASRHAGRHPARPGRRLWLLPLALLVLAALWFWLGSTGRDLYDPALLWAKLGRPLLRTLAFVAGGLLVGQLIEGLGWTARLGVLAWPLIRLARLPREAGAAFSAAFASGVGANTLLYTSWQEGRLDKRQLVLANILNAALPAYFLHLPTTFFVVYALLGRAALVYFGLTLAAALLRTLGVILLGRLLFSPEAGGREAEAARRRSWSRIFRETWDKFQVRLRRMLLIIVPVYILVFLLARSGFFAWLGHALAGWISSQVVPVEAMSVIVFAVAAEFTSGFAAAGALMHTGSLALKQVVTALLLGNVAATPLRALRHQLPHYLGIYSPRLGAKLLALGQGARVLSVLVVTVLYIWLG